MTHSIGLGMIGMNEKANRLLAGVLQNRVVPTVNIHIVESNQDKLLQYEEMGVRCNPDVSASILRSEIMILSGQRQELATTLSSICGVTRGKILVSTVEGRDCQYIQSRVAKATNVVSAEQREMKNEVICNRLTFSSRFPQYMRSAVHDIFESIGEIEIVE